MELHTIPERLKYTRKLLKVTRRYLSEKHGIPSVTLKAWENGSVQPSKSGIDRCIDMYKEEGILLSEEWILNGTGLPPKLLFQINQFFSTPKEEDQLEKVDSEEIDDEILMLKDIENFKINNPKSVAMVVCNDDMSPYYKCGDYIGGKLRFGSNISLLENKDCIVYLKNGECFFRRIINGRGGGYNLVCLNPKGTSNEPVLYNVDIESAAPVVFHRWRDD